MRKIKFRVLYKNEIQHLECPSDYRIDTNGRLVSYNDALETDMRHLNDDYSIQQYTGFKDIHGKEIYEGDMVKCKIWDSDSQSIDGQVKFIKGAFGIECYEKDAVVEFIYICEFGSLEVLDSP